MSAVTPNPPHALVVDDDAVIRMLVRMVLESSGCQVDEAETGADTLRICTARMPDFVFLDAVLPDVDGFDLCRQIRGIQGGRGIPIVMVTGLEAHQAQQSARQAEASACISKPIDIDALQKIAARMVRQHG